VCSWALAALGDCDRGHAVPNVEHGTPPAQRRTRQGPISRKSPSFRSSQCGTPPPFSLSFFFSTGQPLA